MKTILFVGSNPSNASTCDVAFHGSTKSSIILTEWCKDLDGLKMHVNVLNEKTEGNRPLKQSEIKSNLERLASDLRGITPTKIVALGKTAGDALDKLKIEHFKMFHPSGKNRLLNDKALVENKVKEMVAYCSSESCPQPTTVED